MRLAARGGILKLGRGFAQGKTLEIGRPCFSELFAQKADFHQPDDLQKINP
jgi:hypothetical protein